MSESLRDLVPVPIPNPNGRPAPAEVRAVPPTLVQAPPAPPAAPERPSMRQLREGHRAQRRTLEAGDRRGLDRQQALGKLSARQRLEYLLDEGSFTEVEPYRRHRSTTFAMAANRPATDGVITGSGTVDGTRVFVYAQDFAIFGGSLGEAHAAKVHKLMDLAVSVGAPIIALHDGGGARIQEGVTALAGFGGIFRRSVRASGVVPQISVVLGPCAGGAAYSPVLTDFVFMVRGVSQMYLTGPGVVQTVTGESVTAEELGGTAVHGLESGVATFVHDDERGCLDEVRYLISLLPSNNLEMPPVEPASDPADRACSGLTDLVPADPRQAYDMHAVLTEIVDDGDFLEFQPDWGRNVICALARVDGHVTGFVANQPLVQAGALDISASEKAARFVRTCDAFNISLVSLVDVPGFLPGTAQEKQGIIRHGAKLLYAYCEASVPRIQVILRKAYGGAYIVMDSRSVGADLSFAWPSNEIAVMGAEGAVGVIFRRELAAAEDPEQLRIDLIAEYTEQLVHPYHAAEAGLVDDVIDPEDTRRVIAQSLALLRNKRDLLPPKKHGNPPT